jgi:hypothetical protein
MPLALAPETQRYIAKLATIRLLHQRSGGSKLRAYWYDLAAFMYDMIEWPEGRKPTQYQLEIAECLYSSDYDNRIAEYGPHGVGKSFIGAVATHHFAQTSEDMGVDWKCVTTASSWTQLKRYFWPEVHKTAAMLKWDKIGRRPYTHYELLDLAIKLEHGTAFAVASSNPSFIEGAHAKRLFYLFDESKAIIPDTFNAVEGAFSNVGTGGYEAYALALSTPGDPIGRFWEICTRKPGYEDWHVIHVTCKDALKAGVFSKKWVEQRRRQWGENSQLFQNRVMGEFFAGDTEGVIPLAWIELAVERWREWTDNGKKSLSEIAATNLYKKTGVDVAYTGEDKSVISLHFDQSKIYGVIPFKKLDTMAIAGKAKGITDKLGGIPVVDTIGLGAGVFNRLEEQGITAEPFVASARSDNKDKTETLGFINKRSAAWWQFREKLDPESGIEVCLPPDETLIGDLAAPKKRDLSNAKIQVEAKVEIKKRLGRSTDFADAVIMAEYEEQSPYIYMEAR